MSIGAGIAAGPGGRDSFALRFGVPVGLVAIAAAGWWWSASVAGEMSSPAIGQMGEAMFVVLVVAAGMSPVWLVVFTVLIVLEKTTPAGEQIALGAGVVLAVIGVSLLFEPSLITAIT
ncbi:MAG: hypothetical protein H0U42_06285 [Thermoleophilaceae bacterium]|nr:hypothetical protein [Thermoleophilaceae bacterium]